MQIHDLNDFTGSLGVGAYLAIDNGTDTGKISTQGLLSATESEIDDLDSSLNARIDNIIAGSPAPSESEIIDARYGADGVTYPSLGAAIRTQFTAVKNEINHLDEGKVYINDNIYSWYFGYFSSDGSFNSDDSNVAPTNTPFVIKAGQKLTIKPNGMNVQIRIYTYNGGTYTQVSSTIYTADTELDFAADTYISLHANKTGVAHLVVSDIDCDIYIESLIKQYIDSAVNGAIDEITEYTDENLTADSNYDSVHDGYYAYAADGANPYTANADYISYELTIKHPCTLYVSTNTESYLSVCVFDNDSYDNGVRYRDFGAEHTLPTSANPVSLNPGQVIIISEDKDYPGTFTFILTDYKLIFNGDVPLAPEHIAQVEQSLSLSKKYIKYVSGSGADSSTERVEIYIPTAEGYIKYDFLHCVVNNTNADIWRMGYATHVDNNFSNGYAITTAGEWECAIKIKGRSDFSGGYMHGDEVMNNIAFIVDGALVDITTLTSMTEFEDLIIIQDSDLYDPNDSVTVFATHGSEHTFSGDGDLIIRQAVTYLLSEIIDTSYMAMFPIAKAVSEVLVPDKDFVPIAISGSVFLKDTESVTLYKNGGAVMAQFSVPKYDFWVDNVVTFMCNDNGGNVYNKCYFANTLSDFSISSGKVVKTETKYKIVAQ